MYDGKERREDRLDTDALKELVIRIEEKLIASQASLVIAHAAMERRLEGMNEFRDTLKDQAAQFITRKELEVLMKSHAETDAFFHNKVEDDIRGLRESRSVLEGKASQTQVIFSLIIAIVGMLISFFSIFFKK